MPNRHRTNLDLQETWWPDPQTGPWVVQTWFDLSDDVPRCVGIDIRSFAERDGEAIPTTQPLTEVTATALRQIPAGALMRQAVRIAAQSNNRLAELGAGAEFEERRSVYAQASRRYGVEHFEKVAAVYTDGLDSGAPTAAVADAFGISRSAAAKQVARCRELGLLGRTVKGRPGGGRTEDES